MTSDCTHADTCKSYKPGCEQHCPHYVRMPDDLREHRKAKLSAGTDYDLYCEMRTRKERDDDREEVLQNPAH